MNLDLYIMIFILFVIGVGIGIVFMRIQMYKKDLQHKEEISLLKDQLTYTLLRDDVKVKQLQKLLYDISFKMTKIKDCDQDIGVLKRSLHSFFSDIKDASFADFTDEHNRKILQDIHQFIDNDFNEFLESRQNNLNSKKLLKLIEEIDFFQNKKD